MEQEHDKVITYYVNGEVQTTEERKLTMFNILEKAGFTPPEQYRLVRENGNKAFSELDEEAPLHEGERFSALYKGPTPVS